MLNGNVSITLPDGQQFFSTKILNVSVAAAVVSVNLQTLAAPITYTASNEAVALQVKDAIIAATTQPGGNVTIVAQDALPGVSIFAVAPDPMTASTPEPVAINGVGFNSLPAFRVVTIIAGPTYVEYTGVSVPSDLTILCTSPSLSAGTYELYIVDYTTYAVFGSFPITVA